MCETLVADGDVLGFSFDTDELDELQLSRDAGRSGTAERIKDDAAGRSDKATEVAHEGNRLNSWMIVAFAAFALACFGAVKKAGGGAGVALSVES